MKKLFAILLLSAFTKSSFGQFTSGNVVVLQIGDGTSALANTGNPILLKEYTMMGVPAFSMAVASTGTYAMIMSGSATSEGGLSLSANGKYLVFAGYNQALPNATAVASSAASLIPRAIGIVNLAGNYSMAVNSNAFHSTNNIRSATSDGLNNYWSAGANDGTDYFGVASPTAIIQNSITNSRIIQTFSNNLYFTTGSGNQGIYQVGTGFPVVAGQSTTQIISTVGTGTGTPSPYSFYFNPTQTICYIADDRSGANGGGIQRWNFAGTWTYAYTISTGSVGARGVVANFSNPIPVIAATTAEGTTNRLVGILDIGVGSSATLIATSPTTTIFRGLAFSPTCGAPTGSATSSQICSGNQTLSINPGGTGPFTYSWTGTGTFAAPSASTTSVSGAVPGNYTVMVTGSCGSLTSVVSVSTGLNPTVSVTSNTSVLCIGQSATLTANGASTYTWNTGSNSPTIVINPTVNTTYTALGSTACGSGSIAFTQSVISCGVGLQEKESAVSFDVFPNPFNDQANLRFINKNRKTTKIFDLTGQLIYTHEGEESELTIPTSELKPSIYFLEVSEGSNKRIVKLIKYQ